MTGNDDETMAPELEAQLDDYPAERGEILVEAADVWRRAGNTDRAIELLNEAIALGGEEGQDATVTLAEVLFDLDRADEAYSLLDTLRRQRPGAGTCSLAGELLESRQDYRGALRWFNIAVTRFDDDELAELKGPGGWFSFTAMVVHGRRRVREALGMPPDQLDESAPVHPGGNGFMPEDMLGDLAGDLPPPREVRVLFWPRDEVAEAHRRWPEFVEHDDVEEIIRNREAANRELAERGVARITMVPLPAARLAEFAERTGGDPTDENTRRGCMEEIVRDGEVISWPPDRNATCWCGSGAKYKKCCGRP